MAAHPDRRADAQLGGGHPPLARGPLTLALDASVVIAACAGEDGFEPFRREPLVAPPLLWPEVRSVLHELAWRRSISHELAKRSLERLAGAPVAPRAPRELGREAWRVADELGWAKTYDAEYVALARLLGCRLVTLDERLRGATERLGFVIGPRDL